MSGILLVGCGKMGSALVEGWLSRGRDPASITIIEPQLPSLATLVSRGVRLWLRIATSQAPSHLRSFCLLLNHKSWIMWSRPMSGLKRAQFICPLPPVGRWPFQRVSGSGRQIVRVMPNTPAAIGRGIAGGLASNNVKRHQLDLAASLMQTAGEFHWLTSEEQIDAVTAVSGSGPAYVFLLAECLAEAAKSLGLPDNLAERLGRITVAGAGEMLAQSKETAAILREHVTSPGGTTEAALEVLMADAGLQALVKKAAEAAFKRSRDLAGS